MNQKLLLAAAASFVVIFLFGWLYYGTLLKDYMAAHSTFMNTEPQMWGIILSSLCSGIMYAYIMYIAGVTNPVRGLTIGGTVGLLAALGFDFMALSMGMFDSFMPMLADAVGVMLMGALSGAVSGWILGNRGAVATA